MPPAIINVTMIPKQCLLATDILLEAHCFALETPVSILNITHALNCVTATKRMAIYNLAHKFLLKSNGHAIFELAIDAA